MLHPTKNDLPETTRGQMIATLDLRLADAIALRTQSKQADWNVKVPHFIALHRLFDEVSDAILGYIDLIAERAVQLGGVAKGTAKIAMQRTRLAPYPLDISTGKDHCKALSTALVVFNTLVREDIDTAEGAGDVVLT